VGGGTALVKFIPLLLSGLYRNLTRTSLIFAQVVFVFTLFGTLQGLTASMAMAIKHTHADRLFTGSRLGGGDLLPVSLAEPLRRFPGVARTTFESQLPCTFQRPDQYVWALGVDPQTYFSVYFENQTSAAALRKFTALRTGGIVGERLAQRLGWKVGEHITLQCFVPKRDGSRDWGFDIVGLFRQVERPEFSDIVLLNYSYLNESRAVNHDTVNVYGVQISNPADAAQIAHIIDAAFANSAHPTGTASDAESAQENFRRIGDVGFLSRTVTTAALISLLIASGALMMRSIRERRAELATLKAIGFTHRRMLVLVLAESIGIWVAGAAVGLGVAEILLPRAQDLVGKGFVPLPVVALGLTYALVGGVISGAVPAWQTLRMPIAAAARR
jgi:putative ABC transport system permease protein